MVKHKAAAHFFPFYLSLLAEIQAAHWLDTHFRVN